jgi:hypothetical protein
VKRSWLPGKTGSNKARHEWVKDGARCLRVLRTADEREARDLQSIGQHNPQGRSDVQRDASAALKPLAPIKNGRSMAAFVVPLAL